MSEELEQAQARLQALETGRLRDAVAREAQTQGLIDPRDLDHVAFEKVAMQPDGSITGVTEFVSSLRASKSHWFKQDNQTANRDRSSQQVPKLSTANDRIAALGIKIGSPEHKKLEAEYKGRWSR